MTPAELYAERFGSPAVGLALFAAFFLYTLPYMVTAVIGAGLTAEVLTEGNLSFGASSALILGITIAYTALGGMRATMWTNVFQGATFLGFMVAAFFLIADRLGGLGAAATAVQTRAPHLFEKTTAGAFAPGPWASWALAISLTVIAFPHMLVRVFAARDATALKNVCRLYPFVLVILWLPAVLFGVWGAAEIAGLQGKASDAIFPLLVVRHLGPVLQGMALAGVLAAVMSTLDAHCSPSPRCSPATSCAASCPASRPRARSSPRACSPSRSRPRCSSSCSRARPRCSTSPPSASPATSP
ncbi:hypothetical protein OV079_21360 [Nannocystis pusilla]|uniref:Uncharacterized protein n=1 Tax=Nannocystis pusilla TaxID=889268 RepID=A0A9X3EPU4_9BACT|nr:hypothetical protein [Nannocystis pusilla]